MNPRDLHGPLPTTRKALLVGISYRGESALEGPKKNIERMKNFLLDKLHFREGDITVLCEGTSNEPTRANTIAHLENFVDPRVTDAQYILVFCGHVTQRKVKVWPIQDEVDKMENDGLDEYLVPSDAGTDTAELIRDNFIRDCLVDKVPPGSQMLAIWDACHSNTLMDLPHYRCNRVDRLHVASRRGLEIGAALVGEERVTRMAENISEALSEVARAVGLPSCIGSCIPGDVEEYWRKRGRVLCVSACKDSEESLEAPGGRSVTDLIIETLNTWDHCNPSLQEFMLSLKERVEALCDEYNFKCHRHHKQSAQLSSEIPLDMEERLFLFKQS